MGHVSVKILTLLHLCKVEFTSEKTDSPRYIYPILDWDAQPGMAAGVVLGGCVLMPVIQVGFTSY